MEQNQERIENKNIINNDFAVNKNVGNLNEEGLFFYIMTLQTDNGEQHQIKIYENSNASELAFNFCKIYNLDFPTMKYLKKCIKQIVQQFKNNRNNENIFFLKDNNSIQEVAEEEIITENSLKKSGTIKKNNNNNLSNNNTKNDQNENEEEENIQNKNNLKNNIIELKELKNDDNNNINININEKSTEKNNQETKEDNKLKTNNKKENEIYEYEIIKPRNSLEEDDHIEQKDYSIDCCLGNDSIEIFSPTEHTTKIEQRSSFRNNSSLIKNNMYDKFSIEKKKNSKNKKMQINNCNKTYNKPNYIFSYNKLKKEYNISSNKNMSNPKDFFYENKKIVTKKNSFNNNNKKKPQSVEKTTKKTNIRTPLLELTQNNRKSDVQNKNKNKYKNKYEKLMTNINEKKNKYFSNYYNYFIKSKNICSAFNRNNISHKYRTNSSINQESNKSKSISQNKITKNLTQKTICTSRGKKDKGKDKSMMDLNSLNIHKNSSKLNLNTILKKENHSKDKKKSVMKNRIKTQYNITYNDTNIFIKNKIMNKRSSSSKRKKGSNGKELFIDLAKINKVNSNGIKKMMATSLLNIHKLKDSQDKKKHSLVTGGVIKSLQVKNKHMKNREVFNKLFRNESNVERNKNTNDKVYCEFRNTHNNNNTFHPKNKRNNTDINFIQYSNTLKNEYKGRLLTCQKIV